jgi:LmbE family N-acetylglucosaminyl deacetylase
MKFINSTARIFVPDGKPIADALRRISHLGIGAQQDDLEFMAFHGILECFACEQNWFGGVTCTNGSGSSRTGTYANFTNAQIMSVRHLEQNSAAIVGQYSAMIQLDYPSSTVKSPTDLSLQND